MQLIKFPQLFSDNACKELLAWVDNLEIGEVKELRALKQKYELATRAIEYIKACHLTLVARQELDRILKGE